ncbi:unnamed protein product [Brassicogethes aeneus]|uniref:C2H2-type domain-containing protein n=1 Tax=Brassicogethes aeneus TaxID=1431903 RepID=A0A9P0AVP1_BRAAE|nr:unnamed protein product [Brassicogethes aeneus]
MSSSFEQNNPVNININDLVGCSEISNGYGYSESQPSTSNSMVKMERDSDSENDSCDTMDFDGMKDEPPEGFDMIEAKVEMEEGAALDTRNRKSKRKIRFTKRFREFKCKNLQTRQKLSKNANRDKKSYNDKENQNSTNSQLNKKVNHLPIQDCVQMDDKEISNDMVLKLKVDIQKYQQLKKNIRKTSKQISSKEEIARNRHLHLFKNNNERELVIILSNMIPKEQSKAKDLKVILTRENVLKCHLCSYFTTNKLILDRHIKRHSLLHKKPVVCKQCDFVSMSSHDKWFHMRTCQPTSKVYECKLCSYTTTRKYRMVDHNKTHLELKVHLCNVCDKKFSVRESLYRHLITHNKKNEKLQLQNLKCSSCDFTTNNKERFEKHLASHKDPLTFKCGQCFFQTNFENALEWHKNVTHENLLVTEQAQKVYSCEKCCYSTKQKHHLIRHKKTHLKK